MISWITGNLGTILITVLLVLIVAEIILSMIKDKRRGRSSCGGNCAHCRMCKARNDMGDKAAPGFPDC